MLYALKRVLLNRACSNQRLSFSYPDQWPIIFYVPGKPVAIRFPYAYTKRRNSWVFNDKYKQERWSGTFDIPACNPLDRSFSLKFYYFYYSLQESIVSPLLFDAFLHTQVFFKIYSSENCMTYILHLVFRFSITFIRRTNYQTKFSSLSSGNRQKRKMAIVGSRFFILFRYNFCQLCNIRNPNQYRIIFKRRRKSRRGNVSTGFSWLLFAIVTNGNGTRPVSNPRSRAVEGAIVILA